MSADFLNLLPPFNATCNALSAICIVGGWIAIKRGRIPLHRNFMISAFVISMLFLAGYLTRHALAGSTKFTGMGPWRTFYFVLLGSHTILAVINLPLVIASLTLGLRNRIDRHRKWAKITLPLWLYVSSTGVLIYFMLYQWFR